jgi:hypothetical protein
MNENLCQLGLKCFPSPDKKMVEIRKRSGQTVYRGTVDEAANYIKMLNRARHMQVIDLQAAIEAALQAK